MLKWIKRLLLLILLIAALAIGIVFTSENNTPLVPIIFGFTLPELSVGLWMTITLLLGAIVGLLISSLPLFFNRYSNKNKNKKIRQLEKELTNLRVSGLKG